jgi:enoyl-CoA hydratase/carnithine racemase
MTTEQITIDRRGAVATIVIDAAPLNLLTPALLSAWLDALDTLEQDDSARCIVVTGAGERAFSAGAKLGANPAAGTDASDAFREQGRRLVLRLETFPKPVVSAVRGWCIGGGFALAQACDIRVASDDARFRTCDAYIGVVPSWGMSLTRLVHWIGRNRAMDMLMLGEDLSAQQAEAIGLLTRVLPAATFDAELAAIADRLAGGSPIIFQAVKQAVRAQYAEGPNAAQAIETQWSKHARNSDDMREGIAALQERRKPVFTGR